MTTLNPRVTTTQSCNVTVACLNVRTEPGDWSSLIASYPQGTQLNFFEVVEGQMIDGNPYWGHSVQGHYYWMGGTDRPQGPW